MDIKIRNSKENLQRHYISSMKDTLSTYKDPLTLLLDETKMYLVFDRPSSSLWLSSFII